MAAVEKNLGDYQSKGAQCLETKFKIDEKIFLAKIAFRVSAIIIFFFFLFGQNQPTNQVLNCTIKTDKLLLFGNRTRQ